MLLVGRCPLQAASPATPKSEVQNTLFPGKLFLTLDQIYTSRSSVPAVCSSWQMTHQAVGRHGGSPDICMDRYCTRHAVSDPLSQRTFLPLSSGDQPMDTHFQLLGQKNTGIAQHFRSAEKTLQGRRGYLNLPLQSLTGIHFPKKKV